jgi:hypothetical protein
MTSPVETITVCCPHCHLFYEDWWRPSINHSLDNFDEKYLDEASSATCPHCHTKVSLPALHVEGSTFTYLPNAKIKFAWSQLSPLQIGRYAEYFVKMEMTLHGLEVYSSEVDDRGIDFVARTCKGVLYEIQVKSALKTDYIFFQKDKFVLRPSLLAAIVLLSEGFPPRLYIIPSTAWSAPNGLLVSRDYEGKKSRPEWGLKLGKKYLPLLEQYDFERTSPGLFEA